LSALRAATVACTGPGGAAQRPRAEADHALKRKMRKHGIKRDADWQ